MKESSVYNFFEQIEIRLLKWISKNHFKIISLSVLSGGLLFVSKLPYFNLFIHGPSVVFLITITVLLFFQIPLKYIETLSILMLLISASALLLNLPIMANSVANFAIGTAIIVLVKLVSSDF